MNKLKFLLLFIFCFGSFSVIGQTTLYLKPSIGNLVPLSRYDRSAGKPDIFDDELLFRNNARDILGLMLELDLNEKWSVSSGYNLDWLAWSYHISVPDSEKLSQSRYSMGVGAGRANRIHRIPMVVKRTFFKTLNYEPTSVNKLSWFDARFFVQGGISFDFYKPHSVNTSPYQEMKIESFYGDSILIREEATILNQQGVSAITGVGTEIYFKGKPLFEVTLFYNQGLRNLIASDVNFQVNSLSGHTRIIARGSSFGATLGIPIRLKTFKGSQDG